MGCCPQVMLTEQPSLGAKGSNVAKLLENESSNKGASPFLSAINPFLTCSKELLPCSLPFSPHPILKEYFHQPKETQQTFVKEMEAKHTALPPYHTLAQRLLPNSPSHPQQQLLHTKPALPHCPPFGERLMCATAMR